MIEKNSPTYSKISINSIFKLTIRKDQISNYKILLTALKIKSKPLKASKPFIPSRTKAEKKKTMWKNSKKSSKTLKKSSLRMKDKNSSSYKKTKNFKIVWMKWEQNLNEASIMRPNIWLNNSPANFRIRKQLMKNFRKNCSYKISNYWIQKKKFLKKLRKLIT